jgi:hypothetical protein
MIPGEENNQGTGGENINVGANNTNEIIDDLEADFKKFNQTTTDQKPEENTIREEGDPGIDLSQAEDFKLQIFLSLMFALLDGMHLFIYRFLTKYKLEKEDLALDEDDKQGLQIYFRTQKVMDLINRMPVEIIGFIHMEWMYFEKFQEFNKKMKELNPEEEEQEEEEEEQEEETMDQKLEKVFNKKKEQFESKTSRKTDTSGNTKNTRNVSKKATTKKAAPKKASKKAAKKAPIKKSAKVVDPKIEDKK